MISKEEAIKIFKASVIGFQVGSKIYISDKILVQAWIEDLIGWPIYPDYIDKKVWYFFVDLLPDANWAHECIHGSVDEFGNWEQKFGDWPPDYDYADVTEIQVN